MITLYRYREEVQRHITTYRYSVEAVTGVSLTTYKERQYEMFNQTEVTVEDCIAQAREQDSQAPLVVLIERKVVLEQNILQGETGNHLLSTVRQTRACLIRAIAQLLQESDDDNLILGLPV